MDLYIPLLNAHTVPRNLMPIFIDFMEILLKICVICDKMKNVKKLTVWLLSGKAIWEAGTHAVEKASVQYPFGCRHSLAVYRAVMDAVSGNCGRPDKLKTAVRCVTAAATAIADTASGSEQSGSN
ncbi:hypothetical protein [Ethanoligenens harbinense]|uniref:hypothetical protein n=1 Tax=Ethanoligenens harbinense TaxID=253239 RepID=UPI001FA732E1|nr:hypothetical protein [Ethanoligenens harbinense]